MEARTDSLLKPSSGAEGARTPDLLGAIQALSQLSYSPLGTRNLDTSPLTSNPFNAEAERRADTSPLNAWGCGMWDSP